MRDRHWVHLERQGEWVWADRVNYGGSDVNHDEQWGTATIADEHYAVCWSYDGDGYSQMVDADIDRYRAAAKQRAEILARLSDYTFQKLKIEWCVTGPQDHMLVAKDWSSIGFEEIMSRKARKADRKLLVQASIAAIHCYLCEYMPKMGVLYTFGYTSPWSDAVIAELMELNILIVDIRYSARSRAAKWRESALRERMQDHYLRLRALGNVNFDHPGGDIELYQPELGIQLAGERLSRGQHLAFMCMCAEPTGCHRTAAAQRMLESLPGLLVVHL